MPTKKEVSSQKIDACTGVAAGLSTGNPVDARQSPVEAVVVVDDQGKTKVLCRRNPNQAGVCTAADEDPEHRQKEVKCPFHNQTV